MIRLMLLLGSSLIATSALAQTPGAQNAQPAAAQQAATQQSIQAQVAQGKEIFEQTCGNQYCHGPGGKGAQGPKLVDVPLSPETVRETVRQGRSGTPMVSFKEVLEPPQIDAVIAYVLNISSGGKLPTAVAAAPPPGPGGRAPEPPPISTVPVAIGKEHGTPAAGAEVFFDSTNMASCRTCHSYNKRGGPLGLDFALARKTPEDILAALAKPRRPARGYAVITVKLKDRTKLTGVRANETEDSVRVYDIAIPPVRRSFAKENVVDIEASKQGIFDHTKLKYTRQQLLDLAALLGSPID